MRRFLIEIIDSGLSTFDSPNNVRIGKQYYSNFIRAAKRLYLCDDFIDDAVHMECDKCNSFMVDLLQLYSLIEQVLDSPDFSDSFGIIGRMKDKLDMEYCEIDDDPEAVIIFDTNCSCYEFFNGKNQEPEEDVIDFGTTSGRVMKYVGPREHWS